MAKREASVQRYGVRLTSGRVNIMFTGRVHAKDSVRTTGRASVRVGVRGN